LRKQYTFVNTKRLYDFIEDVIEKAMNFIVGATQAPLYMHRGK
jgi:hypothetical protein